MTGSEDKALGGKREEEVLERLCALVLAGDHRGVERELAAACGAGQGAGQGAAQEAPAWLWRELGGGTGAPGVTLVHVAAGASWRVLRALLQRGAPSDPPCSERVSPADIAASWGRRRSLQLLRAHKQPRPRAPAATDPGPVSGPSPGLAACACGCLAAGDPTCGAWLAGGADYLAREARALRLRRLLEEGARGGTVGVVGAAGARGRWASSLVYLLLDGRGAAQLDYANSSAAPLPPAPAAPAAPTAPTPHHRALWLAFLASVFYVGKGCRSRPYAHLRSAVAAWRRGGAAGAKDARILDVWRAGAGVVCLPAFDGLTPREALAREALLIEALGGATSSTSATSGRSAGALPTRLCNERAGAATALRALGADPGATGGGADTRRALGLHLARRACLALLAAPPPPLRPHQVD